MRFNKYFGLRMEESLYEQLVLVAERLELSESTLMRIAIKQLVYEHLNEMRNVEFQNQLYRT